MPLPVPMPLGLPAACSRVTRVNRGLQWLLGLLEGLQWLTGLLEGFLLFFCLGVRAIWRELSYCIRLQD